MNSLSIKEVESQISFFCREALKHIVLESRCGICIDHKTLKTLVSKNYIEQFKNNTPLLCIYKKGKPNIYSSKYSKSWDMSTFKKEILVFPNALMTLCMLEATKYYDQFKDIDNSVYNISNIYKDLSKIQLDFYYKNLRNSEGFFINKKEEHQSTYKEVNFSEKDSDVSFIDQGYMMLSYYLYSMTCNNKDSLEFKNFSLEILDMFYNFKDNMYLESFNNCCNLCLIFNIMYEYSREEKSKDLLIDLSEFTLSKYTEKTLSLSNIENITLLCLNMLLAYRNTNMSLFQDSFHDIGTLLKNLYDEDKCILKKTSDKKDIKYHSKELVPFLINLIIYSNENVEDNTLNNIIPNFYKKYFFDSGLITSFPDAPTLDSSERYTNFSLKSDDLLDESMFRITNSISPSLSGLAPIFTKNIVYSTKKNTLSNSSITFDSSINMFLIFLSLHLLGKYNLAPSNNLLNKIKETDIFTSNPLSLDNNNTNTTNDYIFDNNTY